MRNDKESVNVKKKKMSTICTLHQPRHGRMLTWLDSNPTCGITVSKGKEMLAEEEDLWLVPMA